jgi:hypothetical protein
LFRKLESGKDRFELFGKEQSFYQDHKAGGGRVPATNLLHDLPSGTNVAHFWHVRDFRDGLCPACCAMGLLRWASFASASKKGPKEQMTASLHGNTPSYTMRSGANLFETLWLNWPVAKPIEGGAPLWEDDTESSGPCVLKVLTWRSRRVLLAAPYVNGDRDFSVGSCCYCDHSTHRLVKSMLFRPGWRRPSKEPWWDDPHLFRIITRDEKGREKRTVPRLAGPDDPLEAHATVWQSVLQGLLQFPYRSGAGVAQFDTVLVGASQELYKDARTQSATIPPLQQTTAQTLLGEKDWLRELTWRTVSARTRDWHKRPKGHAVIDALCSSAAKGYAIRSSLCAASFLAESELEQAFRKLTQGLAAAGLSEAACRAEVLQEWREDAGEILCRDVARIAELTARGSPLRRLEAKDRGTEAVRTAQSRLSFQKEGAKQ